MTIFATLILSFDENPILFPVLPRYPFTEILLSVFQVVCNMSKHSFFSRIAFPAFLPSKFISKKSVLKQFVFSKYKLYSSPASVRFGSTANAVCGFFSVCAKTAMFVITINTVTIAPIIFLRKFT